jgi:Flp pilus assembly CpaF family ATPase
MSLLSRLDRIRDKDAEIKNQSVATPPDAISQFLERSGAAEATNQETANGSTDTPATISSTARASSVTASLGVEPSPSAIEASAGQEGLLEELSSTNNDSDVIPISKPSMIKVSGGAVTAPLGATVQANGRPIPASNLRPAMPLAVNGTAGQVDDDEDDVSRLYRLKHLIFDGVIGALDPRVWQQPQRDMVRSAMEKTVDQTTRAANMMCERSEREWLVKEFVQEIVDFGPITPFLNDPAISKITVNSAQDVWIERLGQPEHSPVTFRDEDHVLMLIRRIAEIVGGRIDAKVPLLDRPLPDGSRIRAKVPPISPHGPTFSVEKAGANPFTALRRQQAERQRSDAQPYAQLRERIQQRLVQELDRDALTSGNQDRLRGQVEDMINLAIQEERVAMTRAERAALIMELLNEIIGLGPIEPLLNDPEVDEVMVNGPFQIYVERRGKLELTDKRFRDNHHVMQIIERIVAPLGRRIDEKSPMVDGRLRDGSRFNAVIPPLALSGPAMTIRKFARDPFTMTDLINFGTVSREAAQFCRPPWRDGSTLLCRVAPVREKPPR